jgi:hypothetical protein
MKSPRSGRWKNWESLRLCGISERSGKVLLLDFSTEWVFHRALLPIDSAIDPEMLALRATSRRRGAGRRLAVARHASQRPAMSNGRCRLRGGLSTGERTPAGIERIRRVVTKHVLEAGGSGTGALSEAVTALSGDAGRDLKMARRLVHCTGDECAKAGPANLHGIFSIEISNGPVGVA